ncbi:MAG: type III-B CRISPR module-associated protein Cmr5 [Methylomicrobium sp.]|nr:type III-B CRISPR module-associated protein Cmr5 [Methylomicrobium sp.]MBU2571291.1 type III-B CRISPR module-associated protein Cmr5 [Gammaproteobacteria bacterium]
MSKLPSLDQKRAAYAWKVVQGQPDEYGKLAKGAPALIMNNGLMQTLAFYQDKKGEHYKALNKHIIDWLAAYLTHQENVTVPFDKMMDALLNANSQKYRKATEETLALLRWIRQFAAISQ